MPNENSDRAALLREADQPVYDRGSGARTTPMVSSSSGSTRFINGYTTFDAGAEIPLHFHNCEESVLLVSGTALVEVDGERHEIIAGDVTFIPAGRPHRFINKSKTEPMKIFWTYASMNATRTLVATGDERPISVEHARERRMS